MAAKPAPAPAAKPPSRVPVTDANIAAPMPDDDPEKLVAELREAARSAGVQRDDPMMPLLTAFAHAIRFIGGRTTTSDRVLTDATARIAAALTEARYTANAETERFSNSILATEASIIQRIAASIARSADAALTRRIAVFDRNTALLAAGFLFATAAVCGLGGYFYGRNTAYADIHETEAGLQAAFSNNPQDARVWMELMNWNDVSGALHTCSRTSEAIFDHGRHGCAVPLWTEPPQTAKLAPLEQ